MKGPGTESPVGAPSPAAHSALTTCSERAVVIEILVLPFLVEMLFHLLTPMDGKGFSFSDILSKYPGGENPD